MTFPVLLKLGAGARWVDGGHFARSQSRPGISAGSARGGTVFSETLFWDSLKKGEASVVFSVIYLFFFTMRGNWELLLQTNLAFSTSAFVTVSLLFSSSHSTHHFSSSIMGTSHPGLLELRGFPRCGTFGAKAGKILGQPR